MFKKFLEVKAGLLQECFCVSVSWELNGKMLPFVFVAWLSFFVFHKHGSFPSTGEGGEFTFLGNEDHSKSKQMYVQMLNGTSTQRIVFIIAKSKKICTRAEQRTDA